MPINEGLRRNIELKARCADLSAARTASLALGAEAVCSLEQTDTYFHARVGRLKLRETSKKPAELIWYDRADAVDARRSDYRLVPVKDANALKSALTAALGVRIIVEKRRELLIWENVRIHLDSVRGLGTFIEFEAVLADQSEETVSRQRLQKLTSVIRVTDADRIATSYSALAMESGSGARIT